MLAFRSRALARSSRALRVRRTNSTLSDAKGHAPPPPPPPPHEAVVSQEEGFGKGFYITIAAVVGLTSLYKFEQSISWANGNPLSLMIAYYGDFGKEWEDRNSRHADMIQRAAANRSLFEDSKPSGTVNLKFPEVFNSFSPYNNVVGWASNDLAMLQAHFEAARRDTK